jgi:hypothetical protein
MQVGEDIKGALKRPDRIDGMGAGQSAALLHADLKLPETVDGAARELPLTEAKLKHLAVLCSLRERNIISDRAFLIQRRMLYRASLPPSLPAPSGFDGPAPGRCPRWRWKALGIVLPIAAGLGFVGFRTLQPASHATIPASLVSELAAEVDSNPEDVYTLGKAFRLGLYTYTIAGCQTATTLGGQFNPISAGAGVEYVVVTFTVRNDSIRARGLSTADLKIEDASGVTYGPSRPAAALLQPSLEGSDNWLTDIDPGVTKVLAVAFEIPEASLKNPLKLIIPEQGPFASRQASVFLKT